MEEFLLRSFVESLKKWFVNKAKPSQCKHIAKMTEQERETVAQFLDKLVRYPVPTKHIGFNRSKASYAMSPIADGMGLEPKTTSCNCWHCWKLQPIGILPVFLPFLLNQSRVSWSDPKLLEPRTLQVLIALSNQQNPRLNGD